MAGILQRWFTKGLLKKYDRVSIPVTDLHDNVDYQMGAFELGQAAIAGNPNIGSIDRIYGVATNLDEGGDYNIDNLKEPGRYTWTTKVPDGIAIEGRTTEDNKYGSLTVTKVGSGNDRKQVLNFGIDNTQYSRTNPGGNNPWGEFKQMATTDETVNINGEQIIKGFKRFERAIYCKGYNEQGDYGAGIIINKPGKTVGIGAPNNEVADTINFAQLDSNYNWDITQETNWNFKGTLKNNDSNVSIYNTVAFPYVPTSKFFKFTVSSVLSLTEVHNIFFYLRRGTYLNIAITNSDLVAFLYNHSKGDFNLPIKYNYDEEKHNYEFFFQVAPYTSGIVSDIQNENILTFEETTQEAFNSAKYTLSYENITTPTTLQAYKQGIITE